MIFDCPLPSRRRAVASQGPLPFQLTFEGILQPTDESVGTDAGWRINCCNRSLSTARAIVSHQNNCRMMSPGGNMSETVSHLSFFSPLLSSERFNVEFREFLRTWNSCFTYHHFYLLLSTFLLVSLPNRYDILGTVEKCRRYSSNACLISTEPTHLSFAERRKRNAEIISAEMVAHSVISH